MFVQIGSRLINLNLVTDVKYEEHPIRYKGEESGPQAWISFACAVDSGTVRAAVILERDEATMFMDYLTNSTMCVRIV